MRYTIVIPEKVQKDLERVDHRYKPRILAALASLASNPFAHKKLHGAYQDQRSYEVYPYRIIYQIRDKELIVLIIRIGHRQGVY